MIVEMTPVLWELLANGTAALTFCVVMLPIIYAIGVRDGRRVGRAQGVTLGYNRACYLMGVERHREVYYFPYVPEIEHLWPTKAPRERTFPHED